MIVVKHLNPSSTTKLQVIPSLHVPNTMKPKPERHASSLGKRLQTVGYFRYTLGPENHLFEMENHLPNLHFWVPC